MEDTTYSHSSIRVKFEYSSVLVFSQDSVNNHQYTRDAVLVKDVHIESIWSDHILFQFCNNNSDEGTKSRRKNILTFCEIFHKVIIDGHKIKGCQLNLVT